MVGALFIETPVITKLKAVAAAYALAEGPQTFKVQSQAT